MTDRSTQIIGILVICKLIDGREILVKGKYNINEFKVHSESVVNRNDLDEIRHYAIASLIESICKDPGQPAFNGLDAALIAAFPEHGIREALDKDSVGVVLTINENNFKNITINILEYQRWIVFTHLVQVPSLN